MLKNEFIKMMQDDLQTSDKAEYKELLCAVEEVLKDYPSSTEIDNEKTIEGCYKAMYDFASKNRKGSSYLFGAAQTKDFIINYFGLKETSPASVDLFDFL